MREGEGGAGESESDYSDTDLSEPAKKEKILHSQPLPVADMDTSDIVTELTVANFDWLTREHFGIQTK